VVLLALLRWHRRRRIDVIEAARMPLLDDEVNRCGCAEKSEQPE
jgi:hypothetical protein